MSAHAQLQDDVDVGHIVEVPVHFDDVGVIEEQLDFQLPDKLLCYLFLPQQTLLHNLDRANKATHFFPNQEHLPILALPQFLNLLEIHYRECSLSFLGELFHPGWLARFHCTLPHVSPSPFDCNCTSGIRFYMYVFLVLFLKVGLLLLFHLLEHWVCSKGFGVLDLVVHLRRQVALAHPGLPLSFFAVAGLGSQGGVPYFGLQVGPLHICVFGVGCLMAAQIVVAAQAVVRFESRSAGIVFIVLEQTAVGVGVGMGRGEFCGFEPILEMQFLEYGFGRPCSAYWLALVVEV